MSYPSERLFEEVAYVSYYLHWPYHEVMGMDHREFKVYVVEVCRSCGWNHLVLSFVLGRDGLPGQDGPERREAVRE